MLDINTSLLRMERTVRQKLTKEIAGVESTTVGLEGVVHQRFKRKQKKERKFNSKIHMLTILAGGAFLRTNQSQPRQLASVPVAHLYHQFHEAKAGRSKITWATQQDSDSQKLRADSVAQWWNA